MGKEALLVFLFTFTFGLALARNVDRSGTNLTVHCKLPFRAIGQSCLVVDNSVQSSWNDALQFCNNLEGKLVSMPDANVLHDIFNYIKGNQIPPDVSFWIGAYDITQEGQWLWSWNGSNVQMHTPLWGVQSGVQEPNGGSYENCAMLNSDYYYYLFDDRCENKHAVVCAASDEFHGEKHASKPKPKAERDIPKRPECPSPFDPIGDLCFMVDDMKPNTWEKQKLLCEAIGGHLASINDANDFGQLYQYLDENDVVGDLWIGGSDKKEEDKWVWTDGSFVPMGTPFWGQETRGSQEPSGGKDQNCLALVKDDYFFFHDVACLKEKGLICQYDL